MVEVKSASRLNGIGEYYFSQKLREIAELNAAGKHVLNLGIGSPDQRPPKEVEQALREALSEANYHQYQSYKGITELRQAFANWYLKHFQTQLDPESELLPLIGSKEGIMHISMAFLSNPGDKVLVPNPGYPTYRAATKLAGGEVMEYALNEANAYEPDFAELEKSDLSGVRIMWVNYPHMPTGKDGSDALYEKLLHFSRKHEIILVNDNPYGFILTNKQRSILQHRQPNDWVLELNSLSKSHNMSGWRVGALAGNAALIQTALTFKSNMDSGQFKPVMRAAVTALNLDNSWYDSINQEYRKRREKVYAIARQLGCELQQDEVGMFVWARIPSHFSDGKEMADALLEKYRIFVPPGSVFGSEGKHYIRFSLCSPKEIWEEVQNRIDKKIESKN